MAIDSDSLLKDTAQDLCALAEKHQDDGLFFAVFTSEIWNRSIVKLE